jgi:hypothetical protein
MFTLNNEDAPPICKIKEKEMQSIVILIKVSDT